MAEQSSRVFYESDPATLRRAGFADPEPSQVRRRDPPSGPRDALERPIRASFIDGARAPLSLLELDVPAYWDVTERLARALFALRLQVVSSERCYSEDRVVHRLRVVEFDGAPIREARRSNLIAALVSLLDARAKGRH